MDILTDLANAAFEIFRFPGVTPAETVIKSFSILMGGTLGYREFKEYLAYRKECKKSEERVNKYLSRPKPERKPLPPHTYDK